MLLILTTMEQYPYLIAITLILISFFLLLWLVFRMEVGQIFNGSSVTYVKQTPLTPQPMMPVANPFIVQLDNQHSCSLKDGITLKISCQVDCVLKAFWGVSIFELHNKLSDCNTNIGEELIAETFISGSFLHSQNIISLPSHSDHQYYLKAPDRVTEQEIGVLPRSRYPLVLVLTLDSSVNYEHHYDQNDIVAMICLIHVKDSIYEVDSCILKEYLKHRDGRISALRKLYVEGGSESGSRSDQTENYRAAPPDCVICQCRPISHALLPCRHTCVCGSCFNQLERRCPMCRSPITSFFSISENENSVIPEPTEVAPPPSLFDPVDRFINNLIQWF